MGKLSDESYGCLFDLRAVACGPVGWGWGWVGLGLRRCVSHVTCQCEHISAVRHVRARALVTCRLLMCEVVDPSGEELEVSLAVASCVRYSKIPNITVTPYLRSQ